MSEKSSTNRTVKVRADELKPPTTDELEEMGRRAAADPDYSDIPQVTTEEFRQMGEACPRRLANDAPSEAK